jgi:pimeloyl-ACP methyl ester carboxylesterase
MKVLSAAIVALIAAASAAAASYVFAGESRQPSDALPRLELGPCENKNLPEGSRCGVFKVAEDPAHNPVRVLALKVVVEPAKSKEPLEPIFWLPGGPGGNATDDAVWLGNVPMRDEHPVVLLDPRGSDPETGLECPSPSADPTRLVSPMFGPDVSFWRTCRDALSQRFDLTRYTTPLEIEDLDALRRALGYDKIDLIGGSYGTRYGIAYIHAHEDHVKAALLTGLSPMSFRTPLYHAESAQRAFDKLAQACDVEAACHAAFPAVRQNLADILADLRRSPARVTIDDKVSDKPAEATLTADGFADALRVMMYSVKNGRRVPLLLARAKAGDLKPFAQLAVDNNRGFLGSLRTGLLLSVACPEDTARIHPDEVAPATAGSFVGDARVHGQMAACAIWPQGAYPASYFAPFRSDVPTVLVSGELDPVTPPKWGEEARKTLPNSIHLVTQNAHAAVDACVAGIALKVFRTGSVQGVDTSCMAKDPLPPFELK